MATNKSESYLWAIEHHCSDERVLAIVTSLGFHPIEDMERAYRKCITNTTAMRIVLEDPSQQKISCFIVWRGSSLTEAHTDYLVRAGYALGVLACRLDEYADEDWKSTLTPLEVGEIAAKHARDKVEVVKINAWWRKTYESRRLHNVKNNTAKREAARRDKAHKSLQEIEGSLDKATEEGDDTRDVLVSSPLKDPDRQLN